MASKISINLDTGKENYIVSKCKQNDDLVLEALIYENGLALDLTNKEIIIQALKSNNTHIVQNTGITKENNKMLSDLVRDFTRSPGTTKIEILLIEEGKQNATFSFYLEVIRSVIDSSVESSNTVTILEALENKIVEAGIVKQETEQLITSGNAATKGDVAQINASLEQINDNKADKIQINNLNIRINDLVQSNDLDPNKDIEVIDARNGEPTLGSKIRKIDDRSSDLSAKLIGGEYKKLFNSSIRLELSKDNYLVITNPKMEIGKRYSLEFIPSKTFTQDIIQIGKTSTSASMVDTLAINVGFIAGASYWIENYVPSTSDLAYIRFLGNALNVEVNVYTYEQTLGLVPILENKIKNIESQPEMKDETDFHLITKLNKSITELRSLQNVIDEGVSSLVQVQNTEGIEKRIEVPSVGSRKKYMLRVGLHYGASRYTPSAEDVFFDGQCRKDFSDVRFFDANGKMLKAQLGKLVNMDLLADSNLSKLLKTTSSGKIIGFQTGQGILLSSDNGKTYVPIPNTANVTTNISTTYRRVDMYPVFVDQSDNIFAYAGGMLYKLYSSDNYVTKKTVLDFSWDNNGTMIYPDIQDHGMDESKDGALILGADYQSTRHTNIFRSLDGGETFDLSWHNYGGDFQHTHHIHADKYSNKVYAGIDDGGTTFLGARILVTDDNGTTWTDITENFPGIRGKDYYPTYFGKDYRLGGGENYLNGGGMIYKADSSDKNMRTIIKGLAGVRSYADFGTDDLIVAGSQHARGNSVNQILISDDKGESWDVIYSKQQEVLDSSGGGFRRVYNAKKLLGDTEPCIVISDDFGNVKPMRLYKGGNHYYREAYVELEDVKDEPIIINVKTGYMMKYPYITLNGREHDGFVYGVPLNEGLGSYVSDSLGNVVKILGSDFEWERQEEPFRYGDYKEYNNPITPTSGLKLKQGTVINFGKIPQLNFNNGYTVTFWINNKNRLSNNSEYLSRSRTINGLFSVGNVAFFNKFINFGYGVPSISQATFNTDGYSIMSVTANGCVYSDGYCFVTISVDNSGHVKTYVNGCNLASHSILTENNLFNLNKLSSGDLIIGSNNLPDGGFISDIKFYNRIIEAKEVMEIYKGW